MWGDCGRLLFVRSGLAVVRVHAEDRCEWVLGGGVNE